MLANLNFIKVSILLLFVMVFVGCQQKHPAKKKDIVETPEEMNSRVSDNIKAVILFSLENKGKINDSIRLHYPALIHAGYVKNEYHRIWSDHNSFLPRANSMLEFIQHARYYGLYPEDYHFSPLEALVDEIKNDSLSKKDAISWTKAELMLTDAFMKILKDLKEGRMLSDSQSIVSNTKMTDSFFVKKMEELLVGNSISDILSGVQPKQVDYHSLQEALKGFVDKMDTAYYTHVKFPNSDSLDFTQNIYTRLVESGYGNQEVGTPSLEEYQEALKRYQEDHGLKPDGVAGPAVAGSLNSTDKEKFRQVAINLDRFKSAPPYPETYIQVNIPSFYLKLVDADTVVLTSKVVVGKSITMTPELTSSISDMITYPQWTIPASIIRQDILPQLKIDPGYLDRKGFSLVNDKGETTNPYEVDWSKYTTWIPWKVVQGSGDDNALGVFKFNFNNRYSVYLHDTNQRYLFKNENRALSHGCVRVEKWHALAAFIARRDSASLKPDQRVAYNIDSINTWIAEQRRKAILVKKRLPLIINYYTCSTKDGQIIFYNDIYKKDEQLANRYFANK